MLGAAAEATHHLAAAEERQAPHDADLGGRGLLLAPCLRRSRRECGARARTSRGSRGSWRSGTPATTLPRACPRDSSQAPEPRGRSAGTATGLRPRRPACSASVAPHRCGHAPAAAAPPRGLAPLCVAVVATNLVQGPTPAVEAPPLPLWPALTRGPASNCRRF